MENFSHVLNPANTCVSEAEWRLWIEMRYQRHFICCAEKELHVEMSCQIQASCLLCLTAWLIFFVHWVRKPLRGFLCSSSSSVFLQCSLNLLKQSVFYSNNNVHMTSCKSVLNLDTFVLLQYLKCTAEKWYSSLLSLSKSPLGWIYRAPMQTAAEG